MDETLHPDLRRAACKHVARALVASVGGLKAAAEIVGRGTSQVARWQDFHGPDTIALDAVLALEAASGRRDVLDAMRDGDRQRAGCRETLAERLGAMSSQAGTLTGSVALALADGEVTPGEALGALRELDLLRDLAEALARTLTALAGPAGSERP